MHDAKSHQLFTWRGAKKRFGDGGKKPFEQEKDDRAQACDIRHAVVAVAKIEEAANDDNAND